MQKFNVCLQAVTAILVLFASYSLHRSISRRSLFGTSTQSFQVLNGKTFNVSNFSVHENASYVNLSSTIPLKSTSATKEIANIPRDSNNLHEILKSMPPGDVLCSFGNRAHLPFHLHWICNTAGWPEVHSRTILAVSDQFSRETVKKLSNNKVKTYLVEESSKTHGFYSKGYRKLTMKRILVLLEILRYGRGVIMFEGDALWTRNILEDPVLAGPNRSHDSAFYRDGADGSIIGAGNREKTTLSA
jgi:hypothetical protein